MEQAIISADSHVIEVPDLWEKGLPSSLRDRAPKAYFDEGRDAWMFGSADVVPQAVGGLFMAGQRPEQVEEFRRAGFSVARPGGWDPVERIKDMAQDGVSGEVLYPSLGLGFFCVEDPVFQESLFRTYNDWLIQYCKGAPDRLFGVALISAFDVDHAIAEMETLQEGRDGRDPDLAGAPQGPAVHLRPLRAILGGFTGSGDAGAPAHPHGLR